MIAQGVGITEIIVVLIYLLVIVYLGIMGFLKTKSSTDFLVAGRRVHPFVMAMSYGATFISTSAIVGFGGVAGLFGMSLLWLTFFNIFVGIFIAFVFFAPRARRMGHHLDAHTFPEFLSRRYDSRFIQIFAGAIIFLFIPLYAAAVLIGGSVFVATVFDVPYEAALLIFSVIIAAYVIVGGLKGVMYSDALQGSIMFVGMFALLIFCYARLGGVAAAHEKLTDLAPLVPGTLQAIGHQGWTAMPKFGWGDIQYNLWWIVISTITLGVGIGVLAQPQLVVRFMTVRSRRELNRATLVGGLFIIVMTGVAFTVGALSNAYFSEFGPEMTGRVVQMVDEDKGLAVLQVMQQNDVGLWEDVEGQMAPVKLFGEPSEQVAFGEGQTAALHTGRSISIVYARGTADEIIPTYITSAMPKWFALLFLLTLLSAAMSTLSSQFHTVGTSIGRDVYEQVTGQHRISMTITRFGVVIGIFYAVVISFYARESTFIARATAIFFGLCASAFLPAFIGGLFWKRMTRAGAIVSMIVGFVITAFWLTFIKDQEAAAIGLCNALFGTTSLLKDVPNWPVVDPVIVALPIAAVVAIVVSLFTQPPSNEHLDRCFKGASL